MSKLVIICVTRGGADFGDLKFKISVLRHSTFTVLFIAYKW